MNTFITKEFDFHSAISKITLDDVSVDITLVDSITPNISIVSTNVGKFWCESIEIEYIIYMKVTEYRD